MSTKKGWGLKKESQHAKSNKVRRVNEDVTESEREDKGGERRREHVIKNKHSLVSPANRGRNPGILHILHVNPKCPLDNRCSCI